MDAIQLHEQEFVHGRYFDPVTRGCVEEGLESKSAVFVSLPAFALEYPRTHTTKRDFEGHPVRALLQSRNCLESTDSRDKAQVITHNSNGDQVVTVPQIWALVINNYTVITCAPIRLSVLLGKTIKIKPHPKASADTGTESLFFSDIRGNAFSFTDLHFTDPQGKVSCVPLAFCRTWFGLVKYIVEDCLDDEINPIKGKIKYELLNEGPSFQLVTKEKLPVTMDSWLQIMKKTTTGIIYMSLVDPHEIFKRILVTYHKEETCELDNASDISSIIRYDRGNNSTETLISSISDGRTSDSHTTVTSIAKTAAEGKSRNLADKLCGLRAKLQEAKAQVDWERVLALSHEIPILEDRILEWTAENLRSELRLRDEKDVFEESEETLPASTGGCRGPPPTFAETSSHISTDICLPESGSSSRSRSRPRSISPCRRHELLIPAQELSMRASNPPRDTKRPSISYDNRRNISPDRRTRYGTSYSPLHSRGKPRPRERSSVYGFPSHSRAPLEPLASQSRWNTVRSLVLNGQSFSRAPPQPLSPWNEAKPGILNDRTENGRGSQGLSSDSENSRRKRASEKCLARTPNDFSISQALRSYDRDFSQRGDQINEEALNSDISANKSGKLPDAVASSLRLLKTARALPDPLNPADDRAPQLQEDATPRRRNKGVAEGDRDKETRPTLRRLVALAYKAAAMFPGLNMGKNSADASDLFIAKDIEHVPIFLWPTEQKPSMIIITPQISPREKPVQQRAAPKLFSAKLDEEPRGTVIEGQILQTLLAEMHNNLRKPQIPGNLSRECASLYEGTVGRSAIEVGKLIPPKDRDNSEATVKQRELVTPLSQRKWKRAEGEDYDQIGTSFGDSRLSAGTPTPELVTEHLRESHALCLQSDVFDLAGKVLHAFVPEGYDAPIVSKYWGAVHKLLRQDMVDVLLFTHLPVTEILASHLSKIHERVQDIQLGMRTNDGSQPSLNQLPKSFIAASQQLLTLFIVAGNMKELCNSHDSDPNFLPRDQLQTIFEDCNKDLIQCKTEIIQSIRRDDYDGSTGTLAIDSGALLSLILTNLTVHSSESEAFNLTRIYRDYTTKLRSLVRNCAYVRVHDHIPPLIEELDIIGSTLKQQFYTLSDYRKLLHIHEAPGISFLSRDVLDRLLENIDQRSRNIEEP